MTSGPMPINALRPERQPDPPWTVADLASQLVINAAAHLEEAGDLWDDEGRRWQVDRYDPIARPNEITLTRYGHGGTGGTLVVRIEAKVVTRTD